MSTKGSGCTAPLIYDLDTEKVFSFTPYSLWLRGGKRTFCVHWTMCLEVPKVIQTL